MDEKPAPAVAWMEAEQEPGQAMLTFSVGRQWFALPMDSVEAVVEADRLQPVMRDRMDLAGYVEMRGRKVLVLDMTWMLGAETPGDSAEQIILLRAGQLWAGLITEGVSEMVDIPDGQLEQLAREEGMPRCVRGVWQADGRAIAMVDVDLFLGQFCRAS